MVEVPDAEMAKFVLMQALEYGEYGEKHDTAHEGPYGQAEYETEWSLNDLDPAGCDVEYSDGEVRVFGFLDAEYIVQVMRSTRVDPAAYERRTMPLDVCMTMPLDDLPAVRIDVGLT